MTRVLRLAAAVAAIAVLAAAGQADPFKSVLDTLGKPRQTALADMDGNGTEELLVIVDDPAEGPAGTPLRPWMVLVEHRGQAWTAGAGHAHAPRFHPAGDGRSALLVDGAWLHLDPEQLVLLPFGDFLSSPEVRTGTGRVADKRHFATAELGEIHPEMMRSIKFPFPGTAHDGTVLQLVGDAYWNEETGETPYVILGPTGNVIHRGWSFLPPAIFPWTPVTGALQVVEDTLDGLRWTRLVP